MLSVKLLVLDALIDNLTNLLCQEEVPVFFDTYLDMLEHFMHARSTLHAR